MALDVEDVVGLLHALKEIFARMPSPRLRFELLDLPLFDSEMLSDVPHNAYHDAIALRAYVLAEER